jgi:peptide/nickel transport system substrate-binding protein
MKIWQSLGSLWLVLVVLLVGCGAPQSPGATQSSGVGQASTSETSSGPKRITVAIMSDPPTISSAYVTAGSGTLQGGDALEELLNAGLTRADDRGTRYPEAAESIPTIENGQWKLLPDGRMETTWKLKPNLVWHDGAPFTADDLVFTATLGQDRELPIFVEPEYAYMESVEAPDPRTLVIKWNKSFIRADMVFRVARPKHVLEKAYREEKASVLNQPYWTEQYLGTGPFRLREFVRSSHLILDANDRYVLGRPKIDEILVKFITDDNALMANILAGEVDLTMGRNLSLQQAMQIRDQWQRGHVELGYENWLALYPQFLNPGQPALLELPFRRALVHAIDRQQLVDTLLYGLIPVAHSFVNPSEVIYKDIESQIVRYDHDPRRSIQLIEGLGYRRGPDGLFRDASDQPITLEVRTSADDDTHEAGVFTIADSFKRVGIAAEPFLIPQAQRNDREFNSTYPGVRFWRLPNDLTSLDRYHTSNAPRPENRFAGGNRSRYMNPEFDGLIERYLTTIPPQERTGVLGQIVHHMTDQLTTMGLWYNVGTVMVANRIQGVVPKKTREATETWGVHQWEIK